MESSSAPPQSQSIPDRDPSPIYNNSLYRQIKDAKKNSKGLRPFLKVVYEIIFGTSKQLRELKSP